MASKHRVKKEKTRLSKLIEQNEILEEEEEHELTFYIGDRVKLMKEVLKIIRPKKIKSMAPDCIKSLDMEEINSMLLEELLGISNKRLKYIFNGQNINEDTSSSSDPEEERPTIDIISLDDVSEDEFIIDLDSDNNTDNKSTKKHKKTKKIKEEPKEKRIKKEKPDRASKKSKKDKEKAMGEENLMSVLELLELQARARAIRSQLQLEAQRKKEAKAAAVGNNSQDAEADDDDEDAVIIESPTNDEIVITSSSDSEEEIETHDKPDKVTNVIISDHVVIPPQSMEPSINEADKNSDTQSPSKRNKIKLIRNRSESQKSVNDDEDTIKLVISDDELPEQRPESETIVDSILSGSQENNKPVENEHPPPEVEKPQSQIDKIVISENKPEEDKPKSSEENDLEEGEVEDKNVEDCIVINVDQSEIDGIDEGE